VQQNVIILVHFQHTAILHIEFILTSSEPTSSIPSSQSHIHVHTRNYIFC